MAVAVVVVKLLLRRREPLRSSTLMLRYFSGWTDGRTDDLTAAVSPQQKVLAHPGMMKQMSCLTWSPDGRYLVAGSKCSGSILVYDMNQMACVVQKKLGSFTVDMQFSPDGMYLLASQGYENRSSLRRRRRSIHRSF